MNFKTFRTIFLSCGFGELEFHLNSSNKDVFIDLSPIDDVIGYLVNIGEDSYTFKSDIELLSSRIFDDHSLEEVWDDVVIDCIDGLNEEDYLMYIKNPNFYLCELIEEYRLNNSFDLNSLINKLNKSEYIGNVLLYAGTRELKYFSSEDNEYVYYVYETFCNYIFMLKKSNGHVSISFVGHYWNRKNLDLTNTFFGRKYDCFSKKSSINKSERYKKILKYERLKSYDFLIAVVGILFVFSLMFFIVGMGLFSIYPILGIVSIIVLVTTFSAHLIVNISINKSIIKIKKELFPSNNYYNLSISNMFKEVIKEANENGFDELHNKLKQIDAKIGKYGGFYEDNVVDLQFENRDHEFYLLFYNTFVLIEIDEEGIDKKVKLKYDNCKSYNELQEQIYLVIVEYLQID